MRREHRDPDGGRDPRHGPDRVDQPEGGSRVIDLDRAHGADENLASALRPYLVGRVLDQAGEVLAARRLQASVFRARGFVAAQDVANDGTLRTGVDPWAPSSEYFAVARAGAPVATARQITPERGLRLPTLGLRDLSASGLARLRSQPAGSVVEISALARRAGTAARARDDVVDLDDRSEGPVGTARDVVAVYVAMWQRTLRRGHQAWVMAVDVEIFERLRATVAGAALQVLGPPQQFWGPGVLPAVLWCQELAQAQRDLARTARSRYDLPALLPLLFPPIPVWSA